MLSIGGGANLGVHLSEKPHPGLKIETSQLRPIQTELNQEQQPVLRFFIRNSRLGVRFLQTDPMGYEDSLNLYQAFNQNPVNFTDPMGLTQLGPTCGAFLSGETYNREEERRRHAAQWRAIKLVSEGISNASIQTFLIPAKYLTLPFRLTIGFDFNMGVNFTKSGSILQGEVGKKNRLDIVKEQTVVLPLIGSVKQVREDIKSGNLDNILRTGGSLYFNALFWSKVGSMIKAEMAKVRGLGDSKTSPWLADKRVGIRIHLEEFREGGSFLVPKSVFEKRIVGASKIGRSEGLFITSKSAMDKLLKHAKGSREYVKTKLGIPKEYWNEPLVRIDIKNPLLYNARFPSGFEAGANILFKWGGYTSGGLPEIIIDQISKGSFSYKILRLK